ncbi:MAG TPA: aldo/keto reductase [Tepidisphaeraceae bacterium]|jgi:L-glyceraldehyde 3-phosphate reductase
MPYTAADKRYDVPADWFRRCGASGLLLPAISLGCWHNFGGVGTDSGRHTNEADFHENCRQMLFTAFDHGITHFDLANNYGPPPGSAESRVGRILKEDLAAHRDELIISSKAGYGMWAGPYGDWGSRKYLIASCDQSLNRMGLEYFDIFYSHRPDPKTPLEETLFALDTIVRQGKALYAGLSNYSGATTSDVARLCDLHGWAKPIIHQPRYSMFSRWVEKELLPNTDRAGMGTIAFTPLAQGLLTDKYLGGVPADSRAKQPSGFLKEEAISETVMARIHKLAAMAKIRGQSLAQMALAWTLRPQGLAGITSALIGASRPSQIVENVKYRDNTAFSDDELKQIETILA